MSFKLNLQNIVVQNKVRDMLPSISITKLRVRCNEYANSRRVQS